MVTWRLAAACALAPLLLLAGCDAFFSFNLLKGLDKVPAPNPSQYDYATAGSAGLEKLQTDLGSQAIVNALTADPTATATIESNLQATYTNPSVPVADQQLAASLYADVNLKTTAGNTVVNNAVTVAMSGTSGQNVQQILQDVIPANVRADPTAFAAMVTSLLNANLAYQFLGGTVPPAPPNVNMGDVAQKAAVALTMQAVVTTVMNGPPALSQPQAIDQMFAIANGQSTTLTVPDPFSPAPAYIQNIFTAAGATLPS